jgi:hypothetical protein
LDLGGSTVQVPSTVNQGYAPREESIRLDTGSA